ncbi:hypothetical protein KEM48_006437 [Puccinia striiformis f. sp. tritici PST-130]|nr:hypothetical protein KEM48_006437 [Puccinia striiformis f. sp. tritici PST-130]
MFITRLSVSASFTILSLSMYIGATPMGGSALPPNAQLLQPRSSSAAGTSSAGIISHRMQEAIQTIEKDMWKIDHKLTKIRKLYAVSHLSGSQSSHLNSEIEKIMRLSDQADGRSRRIVDTFPNSTAAATAMKTILKNEQSFGASGYLSATNNARKKLIKVAQRGGARPY